MHIMEENNFPMENWYNKLAIVTGADQDIGSNISIALVNKGLIVIGLAANIENVLKIRAELPTTLRHKLYPLRCDITNENQVEYAFHWIQNTYGGIDMLVNCAGISSSEQTSKLQDLKYNLDCCIKGIKNCTERAFINMKNRLANGRIVLVDSLVMCNNTKDSKLSDYSRNLIIDLTDMYQKQFSEDEIANVNLSCITNGYIGGTTSTTISSNLRRQTINCRILKPHEISNVILYAVSTSSLSIDVYEIILKSF